MNIAFRVDASSRIGTGHVVRCLALARAFRSKGVECRFIHRLHEGHMGDAIRSEGFPVDEVPAPTVVFQEARDGEYERWLGVPIDEDCRQTAEALRFSPVDWLIVDHYALSAEWQRAVRPHARNVAVIDDLANREHDCDLLLDQNFFRESDRRYDGLLPPRCRLLTGPRFALMRSEYAEVRRLIGPRRGPVSRVLVFYGGADVSDQTTRALHVLSRSEFSGLAVDVVIGTNHPNRERVADLAAKRPWTDVYGRLDHLAGLMAEADLAMGGGGATTWERCATGLPSIVTAVAENQVPLNRALAEDDRIVYVGRAEAVTEDELADALRDLVENPGRSAALAQRAWSVTDGLGALRVAEVMFPSPVESLSLRSYRQTDNSWVDTQADDAPRWHLESPYGLPLGKMWLETMESDHVLNYSIDPTFRNGALRRRLLEQSVERWHYQHIESPAVQVPQVSLPVSADCGTFLLADRKEIDLDHEVQPRVLSLTVLSDAESHDRHP